jgi:trehalose utilization protein
MLSEKEKVDGPAVLVWSDDALGDALEPAARQLHPEGVAHTVACGLRGELETSGAEIAVAGLHEADQGLSVERLDAADVLVWWGHEAHEDLEDRIAEAVQRAVLDGLGLIALHSAHHSKPFRALMGTSCDLRWREQGDDQELIWTLDRSHPIAAGISNPIELGRHEVYGEPFEIPAPDQLVFLSSFTGGEVFRSGCCFQRGLGRIFYFGPGHETHRVFEHPEVRRVIANAVMWAAPTLRRPPAREDPTESAPIWRPA